MSKIYLDKEYGVNPSISLCFVCGEAAGIALLGRSSKRITGKREAPRQACYGDICNNCQNIMKEGIFFIQVMDGEEGKENPYRTGKIMALKQEAVERMIGEGNHAMLKHRMCFVEKSAWEKIGLPEPETVST